MMPPISAESGTSVASLYLYNHYLDAAGVTWWLEICSKPQLNEIMNRRGDMDALPLQDLRKQMQAPATLAPWATRCSATWAVWPAEGYVGLAEQECALMLHGVRHSDIHGLTVFAVPILIPIFCRCPKFAEKHIANAICRPGLQAWGHARAQGTCSQGLSCCM